MQRPHYQLEENPVYTEEIPKLLNSDPVVAESGQLYELISRMLNNTRALARKVESLEGKEKLEWFEAELLNDTYHFSNGDGTYRSVRYRKEGNIVFLDGWVSGAELLVPIFILPEGFRPIEWVNIAVSQTTARSSDTHHTARLHIQPTGEVLVERSNNHENNMIVGAVGLNVCFTAEQ